MCGKITLRKEARLVYNQSQDVFYYVWDCFMCHNIIYEEVSPEVIENVRSKKATCLFCQDWNDKAGIYNNNLFKAVI